MKHARPISWLKAALKDFGEFPAGARDRAADALTMIAEGAKPDIAKPLSGLGSGVWELAIKERRRVPGCVRTSVRERHLGRSRISEEVQKRRRHAEA